MNRLFLQAALALLSLSGTMAFAGDRWFSLEDVGSARLVVKSPTGHNTSGPPEACADTLLDESRMAFFLKNAMTSTEANYSRGLVQGDCTADGFVLTARGKAYRLTIDSATGWGAVESGPQTIYLYCEKCEGILEKGFDLRQ